MCQSPYLISCTPLPSPSLLTPVHGLPALSQGVLLSALTNCPLCWPWSEQQVPPALIMLAATTTAARHCTTTSSLKSSSPASVPRLPPPAPTLSHTLPAAVRFAVGGSRAITSRQRQPPSALHAAPARPAIWCNMPRIRGLAMGLIMRVRWWS